LRQRSREGSLDVFGHPGAPAHIHTRATLEQPSYQHGIFSDSVLYIDFLARRLAAKGGEDARDALALKFLQLLLVQEVFLASPAPKEEKVLQCPFLTHPFSPPSPPSRSRYLLLLLLLLLLQLLLAAALTQMLAL
jgi:hypothetical protein